MCSNNPRSEYYGGYAYQKLRKLGISEQGARFQVQNTKIYSFQANQLIWKKGEIVTGWSCVITGLVAASISTNSSSTAPISIYGDGAWFGEFSILNNKPAYADHICLNPTDVLTIPSACVIQLIESEARFAANVARMISWRAQKTSEMLMLMKHGNPCLRVVMGIAQFAESLAYSADRPPTIGFGEGLSIPVRQGTLAAMCGVCRTKVSEYLHHLALNGWIRIHYGEIEILSLQTWHRFSALQRGRRLNQLEPEITELLEDLKSCDAF